MALLTKFVYGFETNSKKTPFGFINNQFRIDNIIQNAGWFNVNGERLGTGDLTLKDMHVAAKLIPTSEAFFALTEADSGWNIPSDVDQTAPGFAYIIQKAVWVIVKTISGGAVVRVRDDIVKPEEVVKDGEKYMRVPRAEIYKAFGIDKAGAPLPKPTPKSTPKEDTAKPNPAVVNKPTTSKPIITVPTNTTKTTPVKKAVGSYIGYKATVKKSTKDSGSNP